MGKKRETLPAAGRAALRGRRGPVALRVVGSGRDVPLPSEAGTFGIGADAANHLVIDDRFVSAFHCALERDALRMILRDRQSRNGTWVNGTRVQVSEVAVGSRIVVGGTTLSLVGAEAAPRPAIECLVGEDERFRAAVSLAQRAAPWDASVLIIGESGSGKELVARLVHESSRRSAGPFVAINCGAIARDLIESELFGHERGSFTGATDRHAGVFEQADGGTLFLDEIGELPREQQPRLLRAIESRRIRSLGSDRETEVDVRIVAATHRDLRAAAASGDFRLDVYHRLCGVEVRLPALRERPGDIPLLVDTFLAQVADEDGGPRASVETLAALARYSWPGNVRELLNAVRRATLLGDGELRLADMLPRDALQPRAAPAPRPYRAADGLAPAPFTVQELAATGGPSLRDVTRTMMEQALHQFGSHRRAAAALGVSKSTFHDRARRFGLAPPGAGRRDTAGVTPMK